jgi:HD-like signal output (HDOD) protein
MATILQAGRQPRTPPDGSDIGHVVGGASLLGLTVGSYTILNELGRGGMGCVYLAEHALIGRKAAIKVLNSDIASDPEVVSRFFTEARAVNDIRHPNIVEVTDFGQFGSLYCIVMEFLEGETLAARLVRVRTFDEPAVIRIMKQCTSALGATHEQGLVHRDIKPENIFLRAHPDYPDFVKLLDFGIAKLLGPGTSVGHHTKTGSVLGTPSYMSPEQCLGESALDIRSDVYSLGVVIYQMLTGMLPFTGDTLGRLIVCHVNEAPVPPSILNSSVSRAMNDLVLKAMQKKPKDRFQSAREMRDALDRVLRPHRGVATPAFGLKARAEPKSATLSERPAQARVAASRATALARPARGAGEGAPHAPAPVESQPVFSIEAGRSAPAPARPSPGGAADARLLTIVLDRIAATQVDLPELPKPTIRCIELVRSGRLSFTDAARIINELPAIRSRVMKLANSAAFPSLMPATTLELAIGRLGTQGLYTALIEFAAREALEGKHPRVKDAMRRIWPHALGTATLSMDICRAQGQDHQSANAYLAGLLAEVGRPVVGALLLEIEGEMQRAGNRSLIPEPIFLATIEAAAHLGGGAVARRWDLPEAAVEAVERSRDWNIQDRHALSNVVRFARTLSIRLGLSFGLSQGVDLERTYNEGRALIQIDDTSLRRISHGLKERIRALSSIRG